MEGGVPTRRYPIQMLLRIASRNLLASRAKSLIVGGIILFGAMLVVVGGSLVDSIDAGMRRSIQESLGGQIQVYDSGSRDDLALYGGVLGESDLVPFEDFSRVKRLLESVPNVKSVVPMGIDTAVVVAGNLFDVALGHLRDDVRQCTARGGGSSPRAASSISPSLGPSPLGEGSKGAPAAGRPPPSPCAGDPRLEEAYEAGKAHIQRMAALLRNDLTQARAVLAEDAPGARDWIRSGQDLERATDERFWRDFDADPLGSLEFLENRIAPLSMDNGVLFIRYVGTDLQAYQKAFPGMELVEGAAVPPGRRGILLGKLYAEDVLKLPTARRLDKIKDARDLHHRRIDSDEELQRWVKENEGATREILMQLDPVRAREATVRLERALSTREGDLQKLVVELLTTDDANFDDRYRIFYAELAPLLQLYRIKVGDTITIQAPSRSGYMSSVNVKVYGFVQWKGLEKSQLAGMMSVMDLLSFRDLYGYMTPEKAAEISRLKREAGLKSVSREAAEAELFGGAAPTAPDAASPGGPGAAEGGAAPSAGGIDLGNLLEPDAVVHRGRGLEARTYTQDDIDHGVAKNAAVILKDPGRIPATIRDIEAAARRAGVPLEAVSWQQASGVVGQFITLARLILYTAVLIIFAVALVIINNAMVMATLQRVKEIGTMRAIGAQRRFVLVMLLVETVAVGLAFGAAGAVLGAGVVRIIRAAGGIPATNDQVYFFFSGPSLLPHLGAASLGVSLLIVLVVSVLSGLYPALLATRVAPVEAMQSDE